MRAAFILSALAFIVPVLGVPTTIPITKRAGPIKQGSYIIKLKDGPANDDFFAKLSELLGPSGSSLTHDYRPIIPAFAADLKGAVLTLIQRMPEVAYIEQDQIVSLPEYDAGLDITPRAVIDRHRALGSRTDGSKDKGSGTTIYTLDTGVYIEHNCFGGRASHGIDFSGEGNGDENGHGTHTAGTAAGQGYGVATSAKVVAVKVLNKKGSGAVSDFIAAVNWAYNDSRNTGMPSVVTMSIGALGDSALDDAVKSAVAKGLHFTVAAGNNNGPAEMFSPGRVSEVNTIGAVDSRNNKALFSNYGKVVDVWAPGVNIKSAWIGSPDAEKTMSGTSMATPHVAGITASMLSRCPNQLMSPTVLSQKLKDNAKIQACFGPVDLLAGLDTPNKGIAQLWNCSE